MRKGRVMNTSCSSKYHLNMLSILALYITEGKVVSVRMVVTVDASVTVTVEIRSSSSEDISIISGDLASDSSCPLSRLARLREPLRETTSPVISGSEVNTTTSPPTSTMTSGLFTPLAVDIISSHVT